MGSNSLGGKLGKWSSKCVFLGKACQVGKSADSWTIYLPFLAAVPEIKSAIFSGIGTPCRRLKNEAIPKARTNNVENIRKAYQPRIAKSLNKACLSPASMNKIMKGCRRG